MSKYHANNVIGTIGNNCTNHFVDTKNPSKSKTQTFPEGVTYVSSGKDGVVTIKNYVSPDGKFSADNVVASMGDNCTTIFYK